jgi:polygalacturonase
MRALLVLLAARLAAGAVHSVLDFGADPTAAAPSTAAIHSALAAIRSAGGGTLYFPPGHYTSGPFNLSSNTVLLLDFATLRATPSLAAFKLVPALPSYGEGRDKLPNDLAGRSQPFVGIYNASNVSVTTNSSGTLHGSGETWWGPKAQGLLLNTPPHLIEAAWSTDLAFGAAPGAPLNALTFINSPFWNLHIYDCTGAWVHDLTILADIEEGNTDGADPDSSRNVLIERIVYVGGDDGVAIKSGWDQAGIDYGVPSENITVRDSSFTTRACCVCAGSEMSGGVRNVTVYNVSCVNVGNAFQVKTTPGRGGYVHGLSVTDSTITGASTAFMVMMTYGDHPQPPLTYNLSALPVLSDFSFACVCAPRSAPSLPTPATCLHFKTPPACLTLQPHQGHWGADPRQPQWQPRRGHPRRAHYRRAPGGY